ncbi:hypothetical protein F4814DRAFT_415990 [Daldinia grandis]|nr:hypothetical protein F4814DRAFT_415990 [Daldinia grandis]
MDTIESTEPLDRVACYCGKCGKVLGKLTNLWTMIGDYHITPVAVPMSTSDIYFVDPRFPAIVYTGPVRPGSRDTLVSDCHLQDIACANCDAMLGIRCLLAPDGRLIRTGQLFFFWDKIVLILANEGMDIHPEKGTIIGALIRETLQLRDVPVAPPPSQRRACPSVSNRGIRLMQSHVRGLKEAQLQFSRAGTKQFGKLAHEKASSSSSSSPIGDATPRARDMMAELEEEVKQLKELVDKRDGIHNQDHIIRQEFERVRLTSCDIRQQVASLSHLTLDIHLVLGDSCCGLKLPAKYPFYQPSPQPEKPAFDTSPTQQGPGCVREEVDGAKGERVARECVSTPKAYCDEETPELLSEIENFRQGLGHKQSRQSLPRDGNTPH